MANKHLPPRIVTPLTAKRGRLSAGAAAPGAPNHAEPQLSEDAKEIIEKGAELLTPEEPNGLRGTATKKIATYFVNRGVLAAQQEHVDLSALKKRADALTETSFRAVFRAVKKLGFFQQHPGSTAHAGNHGMMGKYLRTLAVTSVVAPPLVFASLVSLNLEQHQTNRSTIQKCIEIQPRQLARWIDHRLSPGEHNVAIGYCLEATPAVIRDLDMAQIHDDVGRVIDNGVSLTLSSLDYFEVDVRDRVRLLYGNYQQQEFEAVNIMLANDKTGRALHSNPLWLSFDEAALKNAKAIHLGSMTPLEAQHQADQWVASQDLSGLLAAQRKVVAISWLSEIRSNFRSPEAEAVAIGAARVETILHWGIKPEDARKYQTLVGKTPDEVRTFLIKTYGEDPEIYDFFKTVDAQDTAKLAAPASAAGKPVPEPRMGM